VPFVFDASAAAAILLPDEVSTPAHVERLGVDWATAPAHWPVEVASALLQARRSGRITGDQMRALAASLGDAGVQLDDVSIPLLTGPVLDLADTHNLTTYDAAYLELAMRHGIPLATNDSRLRRVAIAIGVGLVE
jgi:predicted nucleic acid-binding protein